MQFYFYYLSKVMEVSIQITIYKTEWVFFLHFKFKSPDCHRCFGTFVNNHEGGQPWRRFTLWSIQIRKDCLWQTSAAVFAMEDVDLILRKCSARFNLLHRTLDNHNETKTERVCLGDGQCRWWRRCSFNTSMTRWPRLRLSALGMTNTAASIPPWRRDQDWGCLPWGWRALQ